jgi:hypothetical protein
MSVRFIVDENDMIIDCVNPVNSGRAYCSVDALRDHAKYLRECVLSERLWEMTQKLIVGVRTAERRGISDANLIHDAVFVAIRASHLNSFDPLISLQQTFDGRLKDKKRGMQAFTSLGLFLDDVECLLRDLYGDVQDEAMIVIMQTIGVIMQVLTRYARMDIWKEHDLAMYADLGLFGIGLHEGAGISGSDWRWGLHAQEELGARIRKIRANPTKRWSPKSAGSPSCCWRRRGS